MLDGVYRDLNDKEGFYAECKQGRDLGFDGKTLIHPKQLETANTVFAPSPGDVENAYKIISAWELAKAEGNGVAVVDGKLVENLHVTEVRRNLALMDAIQSMAE